MGKSLVARCSDCNMNFPKDRASCPVCGKPTWEAGEESYDPDWKQQVERLKKLREADASPLIPNALLEPNQMVLYKDRVWLADQTMRDHGYALSGGEVVQINGEFYEVMGAMFPDTEEKGWWIELIPPLEWDRKVPVLSETAYHELELSRGLRT